MNGELTFVDTNVLVYTYDRDAGIEHEVAREVITALWQQRVGVLSTQVLQEFYWTGTRKPAQPIGRQSARDVIATYRAWPVFRPTVDDVLAATEVEELHQLAFWDALILVSAERSGASTLLSADLRSGARVRGVVIANPFHGAPE
jgi:predicted nucleic acid-binding protein